MHRERVPPSMLWMFAAQEVIPLRLRGHFTFDGLVAMLHDKSVPIHCD